MEFLIYLIIILGLTIAIISKFVITHAANRPANGELKTLERLDREIIYNQKCILKHLPNHHVYGRRIKTI